MAASNEWTEYHLTPTGWIEGNCQTDFKYTEKPIPADRVATYTHSQYVSSVFSKCDFNTEQDWRSPDASDAYIKTLTDKFGTCPQYI